MKETKAETQRRLRIKVSVASYAYEIEDTTIMSDHEFDRMCLLIDPKVSTGSRKLDTFFRNTFDPNTGSWVRLHPGLDGLRRIFERHFKDQPQ